MKIGPHIQNYSDASKPWVRVASIGKSIDNPAPFLDAPEAAIRVFRAFTGDNNTDVQSVFDAIISRLGGYRHRNLYVEIINEPDQFNHAVIDFARAIVPRLHNAQLKVAGPCWSTGTPEPIVYQAWRDAGWAGLDAIGLHGYWGTGGFTKFHALR